MWRGSLPRLTISAAGGPAGNVVTSANPDEALNFGRESPYGTYDARYRLAREFLRCRYRPVGQLGG